jgi:hypothetical protein
MQSHALCCASVVALCWVTVVDFMERWSECIGKGQLIVIEDREGYFMSWQTCLGSLLTGFHLVRRICTMSDERYVVESRQSLLVSVLKNIPYCWTSRSYCVPRWRKLPGAVDGFIKDYHELTGTMLTNAKLHHPPGVILRSLFSKYYQHLSCLDVQRRHTLPVDELISIRMPALKFLNFLTVQSPYCKRHLLTILPEISRNQSLL